ncbi:MULTISPECIES: hypothetical protein [Bacillus]|uniref:hypothetical protein n=1 Tax=Bacillus TaxID=1386 RepID=UPI000BB9A6C4|nr:MULTISPECIES: hypothetical protein [Bacillus]
MSYILEKANVLKIGNQVSNVSIIVKNDKFSWMREEALETKNLIKMDLSHYILTPGHVMLDFIGKTMDFADYKLYVKENYLLKGCTAIVAVFSISNEMDLLPQLKRARTKLLNSPVDYYFAIQVPLGKLTPSLVRLCKKHKIPAIFLTMDDPSLMETKAWSWIKDALYQFPITFVPIFPEEKKEKKLAQKIWSVTMTESKLVHLPHCPPTNFPLKLDLLMKLGIYPSKGDIRIGGEVSYNLYICPEGSIIETASDLDYHIHSPEITVHRGKIVKVSQDVYFRPGFGNECKVTVPGHFQLE